MSKTPDLELLWLEFCAATASKANWCSQYAEIYRFVLPNRTAFNVAYDYDNAAKYENQAIYDFTPVSCAYQRANELHSLLMPKDRVWGKLSLNELKVSEQIDDSMRFAVDSYMDYCNKLIFQALGASNLSTECPNALLDLVGGTGFLKIESVSDDEPIKFTAIPAYVGYIGVNQSNHVDRVWIMDQMQAWRVREMYKGKKLPAAITTCAQTDLITLYTGQDKMADGRYYVYTFHDTDYLNPIDEQISYFQPIITIRDRVHPGESEGRGIAMDTIWQIRDLNNMYMQHNRSIGVRADPAIFYDQTTPFNPYSLRTGLAGVMLPMQNGRMPLQAFTLPSPSPDVMQTIEDLRNQIKTAFMVDPLGSIDQPVHSATEVSIRENRAQRTTSTDMSRLINDLPRKVYEIAMKILVKRGMIKPAMQDLHMKNKLSFQFNSPLQDLQSAQDIQNLAQLLQFSQQFYGEPSIITSTNPDAVLNYMVGKLNLPHNLFRSPEYIAAMMQQMGEQQAEQQAQKAALPTPTTGAQSLPNFPAQAPGAAA